MNILLLNGPNLNLLGEREPEVYGYTTLSDIEKRLAQLAQQHNHQLEYIQSNSEAELIDKIQQARKKVNFILINAAAFTHTSIALRDALLGVKIPFIEIHLSNVYKREPFRHHSYLADCAVGVICGFGAQSYELAMLAAIHFLEA